jgi:hypothetical protein
MKKLSALVPLLTVAALSLTFLIHRFELPHGVAAYSREPSAQTPGNRPDEAVKAQVVQSYGKLPMAFEANTGQTDEQVKFIARGAGYSLFLTPTESVLLLSRQQIRTVKDHEHKPAVLRMKLVGANALATGQGVDEMENKINYFIGNDPSKWHVGISTFKRVRFRQVYPGIEAVYYGNQQQLEYDFTVAAGADPDNIRVRFEGADKVEVNAAGELLLSLGEDQIRQPPPTLYQEISGKRHAVEGKYVLKGDRQVGFAVEEYDASVPLVIDPVLPYSTYLGGNGDETGNSIAVDSAGNAYVTGSTRSTNFPTANAFQHTFVGVQDVFVTKFNPAGSALIYSTYLGGSDGDYGQGITVDSVGNVYLTGFTFSTNFPTANALQGTSGGNADAFVTKLNATGSVLVYSTYLGGSFTDYGYGIAVDSSGNAYITGETNSANFPIAHAFQGTLGGGVPGSHTDAFVTKLNPAGSALVYSTYLGGSGNNFYSGDDVGVGIAVDSAGNAYVTGWTQSQNFPTANAFQGTIGGPGYDDAFVTKFNAAGSALVYSTYLGGSNTDEGVGVAIDSAGNAYITGLTRSTNFPTANAFQGMNHGDYDAFVTKINAAGSGLVYSTYLGGSALDYSLGIAVDSTGNAYIVGQTTSNNFPTANAFQSTNHGGPLNYDAFVTKFNAAGSALVYSTYLGGTDDDQGYAIAIDSGGNAYVTGGTWSADFPIANAFQNSPRGGDTDAFVTKIADATPGPTDFNRDGKPDYALFKSSTRQTAIWYLNNNIYVSGAPGPSLPAGWNLVEVADFNGDGKPDYVLVNTSTRQTAIYYLNNNALTSSAFGPTLPTGWSLVEVADFNRDGKTDYVLLNASTRQTSIWYMNNNVHVSSAFGPTLPVGWTVAGAADFNHDSKPDYVIFNASTRQTAIWYMNNNVHVSSAFGPTLPSGYLLSGTADFDGDGKPDYVLLNTGTHQTAIWYMNNNVHVSSAFGPTIASGWTLIRP